MPKLRALLPHEPSQQLVDAERVLKRLEHVKEARLSSGMIENDELLAYLALVFDSRLLPEESVLYVTHSEGAVSVFRKSAGKMRLRARVHSLHALVESCTILIEEARRAHGVQA